MSDSTYPSVKLWRERHPDVYREQNRVNQARRRARLRAEVLAAYGGICACCKETEEAFLTLDHIHGRPEHHKGVNGTRLYAFVKREGFSDAYRLLCWNCNAAIGLYGVCPHQLAGAVI